MNSNEQNGTDFARELLFIKYTDEYHDECDSNDPYVGPTTSWVNSCPDDVEPRTLDNPFVYSFEETLEDGWHEEAPENQWYIVGGHDYYWLGVDIDGDGDHEKTVDFSKDDIAFQASGALLALSKSGWPHQYTLHKKPPAVEPAVEGVDTMSDSPDSNYRGAVSPWHDDRREVLNSPNPEIKDDRLEEALNEKSGFISAEVDGEKIELLQRKTRTSGDVDVNIPDSMPGDDPLCIRRLAEVRMTNKRHEYGDSPFEADTHLGQLLIANGYSISQATAFLKKYPPDKTTGFDAAETKKQLTLLKDKFEAGDLYPPTTGLHIKHEDCDCIVHGDKQERTWDGRYGLIVPDTPINRADPTKSVGPNLKHEQVMEQTEEFMHKSISMNADFVAAPEPGTGKSRGAIRAIAKTGERATVSVNVNSNKFEAAEQLRELSTEYALYPSTTMTGDEHELAVDTHCPVACEEHGEAEKDRLRDLAEKCGGSPGLAHAIADNDESSIERFACQRDGDCNYTESWEDFDGSAQVLIGHYTHLNLDSAMALRSPEGHIIDRRTVIVDEFPGEAFETTMCYEDLSSNIRSWLATFEEQEPTGDVWEALDDVSPLDKLRRASTVEDLYDIYIPWELVSPQQDDDTEGVPGPIEGAVENGYHPETPLIAYMLSKSERMSNDWRASKTSRKSFAMSPDGTAHFINPPQFTSARHVVGLDATANKSMWRVATGIRDLPVVETMNKQQKHSYYRDALDLDIIQLSESMRPFASVDKSNNDVFREDDVGAVVDYLEHIAGGSDAGVISSLAGFKMMDKHGIDVSGLATNHFGNFKGDNSMRHINYGALIGALHPGDYPIYKWAALAGECAERDEAPDGDRSDWEVNYQNEVADSVMNTLIDGEVKQALMRFSRNDETGTVLIYTDRIPDEVPRKKAELRRFVESRVNVLDALDSGARTFDQVKAAVHWSRRTVRRAVDELLDLGLVKGDNDNLKSTDRVSDYGVVADKIPKIAYRGTDRQENEVEEEATDPADVRSGLLGLEYLEQCNRVQILADTGLAVAATPEQLTTGDNTADPQARFVVD